MPVHEERVVVLPGILPELSVSRGTGSSHETDVKGHGHPQNCRQEPCLAAVPESAQKGE